MAGYNCYARPHPNPLQMEREFPFGLVKSLWNTTLTFISFFKGFTFLEENNFAIKVRMKLLLSIILPFFH